MDKFLFSINSYYNYDISGEFSARVIVYIIADAKSHTKRKLCWLQSNVCNKFEWGCGKRPKPVCWKTTETFWVVGKRPKPSCWKTAEISAVFQQSHHIIVDGLFSAVFKQLVVVVGKRQKFRQFSNKVPTELLKVCFLLFSNNWLGLLENGRNFCCFPCCFDIYCLTTLTTN